MPAPPTLLSPALAVAMSHPTRLAALVILLERKATTKELAAELDVSRTSVSYHLDVLLDLGCIHLVSTVPAGGGRVKERTFKAVDRAYFDAKGWEQLGSTEKLEVSATLMRVISEDVNQAISQGTFFDPDDNHISRSPMRVDSEGWREVISLLDGTVDGLFEIQDHVSERCQGDESRTFPIKVEIVHFRSPKRR